jgi:endonuclease/exonuclease/phosphatase (EEP) superfamily protein YafD
MLAQATGSEQHSVLTSRNFPLPIRRAVAARNPDLIKAGGGGANTILVRGGGASQHRRTHLAWLPERRLAHGVLLRDGTWLVNLHASVRPKERIPRDVEKARVTALAWAGARPLIVGGDFNLRRPDMPWFHHAAGNWVDHVFARGWTPEGKAEVPDPRPLSDHRPIAVTLARA